MRDASRIYPLCNKLAEIWTLYPDLRFGQVVACLQQVINEKHGAKVDLFFIEEDEIMEVLNEWLCKRNSVRQG